MHVSSVLLLLLASLQQEGEVPVTIKELDVAGAIREFQAFQQRLDAFREEIGEGREVARETSQLLEELRRTATPENDHNEAAILATVSGYVDSVIHKQVQLVDFLESQRYRISYYANRMASSVRPEDLAMLFGTEEQNVLAIEGRVRAIEQAQLDLADFVDALPEDQFDRESFLPLPGLPRETKKQRKDKAEAKKARSENRPNKGKARHDQGSNKPLPSGPKGGGFDASRGRGGSRGS